MPKVTFSAPVYEKYKKMGGDIIYKRGDQPIIRLKGSKTWRKYNMMWRGNHIFQVFSEYFRSVSQISKQHWSEYKAYIGSSRSGRNPYLKNNIQIMYPDLIGTEEVKDISSPPQYPEIPICFAAYYDTDLDGIIYNWLDNYGSETIIEAGYYNAPGLARPPVEWMRIGKGDLSSIEEILLKGKKFNPGNITYCSVRAINLRGEVSPWHDPIAVDIADKPAVDFSGTPRTGVTPLEVTFTQLCEGEVVSYLWLFGDGSTSELPNPIHTYSCIKDYFTVKLTAFGTAGSKKSKTKYNYIHLTPSDAYGDKIFVCDTWNNRVFKRETSNLDYISKIGSYGDGDNNFHRPFDVAVDSTHIFITDRENHRIVKRLKSDLSFVSKIGSLGSGDNQFSKPSGIALDSTYLYIWDYNNNRVHKRLKSDLSLVCFLNSITSGDSRFKYGLGLCVDSENLYITCEYYDAIVIFRKSDFSFVHRIDNTNFVGGSINNPKSIMVDNCFLWFINFDYPSYSVYQVFKIGWSIYHHYDLVTSSEQQSFFGLAATNSHIFYIDPYFEKCSKRLRKTFNIVKEVGSHGSGNDQFYRPMGCGIQNPYSV